MPAVEGGDSGNSVVGLRCPVVDNPPHDINPTRLWIDLDIRPLSNSTALADGLRRAPIGPTVCGAAEINCADRSSARLRHVGIGDVNIACRNGLWHRAAAWLRHADCASRGSAGNIYCEPGLVEKLFRPHAAVGDRNRIDVLDGQAVLGDLAVFLIVQVHEPGNEHQAEAGAAVEGDARVVEHAVRPRTDHWICRGGEPTQGRMRRKLARGILAVAGEQGALPARPPVD